MSETLSSFLSDLGDRAISEVLEQFQKNTSVEGFDIDLQPEFDLLPEKVQPFLEDIATEAAHNGVVAVEIDDEGIFNIANERARAFAEDRAAEMVGRKYVDGELVNNPDARWVISDTTRDDLRNIIAKAYEESTSPSDLEKKIRDSAQFSPARAKLVAKTETSNASISGTLEGWRASGVVEGKSSLLSDDHDHDDECDENAEAGVVGLDEDFPSGDDGPPYHPGCDCSLVAELNKEGDE